MHGRALWSLCPTKGPNEWDQTKGTTWQRFRCSCCIDSRHRGAGRPSRSSSGASGSSTPRRLRRCRSSSTTSTPLSSIAWKPPSGASARAEFRPLCPALSTAATATFPAINRRELHAPSTSVQARKKRLKASKLRTHSRHKLMPNNLRKLV